MGHWCDIGDGDDCDDLGDDIGYGDLDDFDDDIGDGDDDNVLPFPGCRPSKALNCPTRSQQQQCNSVSSTV